MTSVLDTLSERGFVSQCSDEAALREHLARGPLTVYCGFDPTASSLHLGNLVPLMGLAHFQRAGHQVIEVVGGATGMIGDPSGRSDERNLLTPEQLARNVASVRRQMEHFLDFTGENAARIVNNYDWIGRMTFIDWLRDVGKHFTVNYMTAKESVRRRLESEQGISYTEFSYMTLQAYDYLHLFEEFGCTLQVGGSDQWGNITAGMDLIRKLKQGTAFALTFPLVTTSAGEKFGKSAGNAMWLDPALTSPWDFYQYLVRQEDRDVVRFLNFFTFLPKAMIDGLAEAVHAAPERREAQKALAFEVTRIVHGEAVAREMARAAEIVYHSEIKDLSDQTLAAVFASVPSTEVTWAELDAGLELVGLLHRTGLAGSKGEARRLIKNGGIYVNNVRADGEIKLGRNHLASESFIVLRSGKKNYHLVRAVNGLT
jgi:tyrosyl-tRNA synthetase